MNKLKFTYDKFKTVKFGFSIFYFFNVDVRVNEVVLCFIHVNVFCFDVVVRQTPIFFCLRL